MGEQIENTFGGNTEGENMDVETGKKLLEKVKKAVEENKTKDPEIEQKLPKLWPIEGIEEKAEDDFELEMLIRDTYTLSETDKALYLDVNIPEAPELENMTRQLQESYRQKFKDIGFERIEVEDGITPLQARVVERDTKAPNDGYILTGEWQKDRKACKILPGRGGYRYTRQSDGKYLGFQPTFASVYKYDRELNESLKDR